MFISKDKKPITAIVGFCSIKVPLAPSNTMPILIWSRQQYNKTALMTATAPIPLLDYCTEYWSLRADIAVLPLIKK